MKFEKTPLSKTHQASLDKALEISKMSDENFKHGAIIKKSGRTLAVGINYRTNNPDYLEKDVAKRHASVHAEVAAMNAVRKVDLNGAVLYVARSLKNGEPAMSKPCENCQEAMRERGIKKVFYTIDSTMDL